MFEQQESMSAVDMSLQWKSRIDELATRLMIEGGGHAAVEDLNHLRDELQQYGNEPAASLANSLIAALVADAAGGTALLLKSGLSDLRSSLDSDHPQTPAPASISLADDAELVGDFLVEAREHLSQIEGQMLVLERDPAAMEVIHAVFRAFHTIKGLAGFLEFHTLQAVAHEVETVLDKARNQKLVIASPIVDTVLESGQLPLQRRGQSPTPYEGSRLGRAGPDHRAGADVPGRLFCAGSTKSLPPGGSIASVRAGASRCCRDSCSY
jgi:HPt (histidine-containing phosphotransfer) domain-containing protein